MSKRKIVNRVLVYGASLLIMAFGVVGSVNAGLGISPGNCLPFVISEISGLQFGHCVTGMFVLYVLLQILILRRNYRPINLFQIACALFFGYFTELARLVMGDFAPPGYVGRLFMLLVSIFLIAFGISLYVSIKLVPMPAEGLMMALTEKTGISFPRMKIIVDCVFVVLSLALSLVFFGKLIGAREGTVLSALLVGPIIGLIQAPVDKWLYPFCFGESEENS